MPQSGRQVPIGLKPNLGLPAQHGIRTPTKSSHPLRELLGSYLDSFASHSNRRIQAKITLTVGHSELARALWNWKMFSLINSRIQVASRLIQNLFHDPVFPDVTSFPQFTFTSSSYRIAPFVSSNEYCTLSMRSVLISS